MIGNLSSKAKKKALGTIGSTAPVQVAQAAIPPSPTMPTQTVSDAVKPWNSDVFAPEPIKPSPASIDHPATPKTDKRRKSTVNKHADRQLGALEGEGY